MAYSNRPADRVMNPTAVVPVSYHDRVRWGPILAGLAVALTTQLILSALGAAIGATAVAGSGTPGAAASGAATAVGIWSIISLLISLFLGSWVMARCCGPMKRSTAFLNGAILWAATLALSSWLLASGISGSVGAVAANAGDIADQVQPGTVALPTDPNLTTEQAQTIASNAATAGWSFVLGSLLALLASLAGAAVGARPIRDDVLYVQPEMH
jgi:hypothetical protein